MMDNYNGFYKVNESGFSLTDAIFYNPETGETFSEIVWDIDDDRLLSDERKQILRSIPINHEIRKAWLHKAGRILEGDIAKVVKGRKLPIGKVGKVVKIKPYYDRYKRWCCDYVYFDDGTRTNITNCELVQAG